MNDSSLRPKTASAPITDFIGGGGAWGTKPSVRLLKVQPRSRVADEADVVAAFLERRRPLKTMGAQFGVADTVILAILQRQGVVERHGCFYDKAFHRKRVADYNAALRKYLCYVRAAAEVGCSYSAVYKSAARYGFPMLRGHRVRRETKHAAIKSMATRDPALNLSKSEIARKTGAALKTVNAVLAHRGPRNVFTAA